MYYNFDIFQIFQFFSIIEIEITISQEQTRAQMLIPQNPHSVKKS